MITSSTWVPRGVAASFPKKYEFDEDEFERIAELAKLQLDDAREDLEEAEAEKGGPSNEGDGTDDDKKKKKKKQKKKKSKEKSEE